MLTNYLTDGFKIINNNGEEEIFQIPYNLNNVLPTEEDIIQILSNFNVKVFIFLKDILIKMKDL